MRAKIRGLNSHKVMEYGMGGASSGHPVIDQLLQAEDFDLPQWASIAILICALASIAWILWVLREPTKDRDK